jgi:hypothetical protein
MSPLLVPSEIFFLTLELFHQHPSPLCFLRWCLAPCASCSWSSAPGLTILCLAHQAFGNPLSALAGLPLDFHWSPWPCLRCFGHSWSLPSQVRSSRPQEDLDCPWGVFTLIFGHKAPSGHPQVVPATPTANQDYLTPGTLPPRTGLMNLWHVCPNGTRHSLVINNM